MKKIFLALLFASLAGAQTAQHASYGWTMTATGTTSSYGADAQAHTLALVPSGSPSGCTAKLEGSLDGSNWFDLSGSQTCTSALMFHVASKPVQYVRVNLTVFSGGTSPTLTVLYLGVR